MANNSEIKFRFELSTRPNKDGLTEIFLVVADPKRRRITTEVSVKNEHFGVFKDIVTASKKVVNKRVLTPNKWVTNKDPEAAYKNSQLKKKLDEYEKAYDRKKEEDGYVNKEVVIKAVTQRYIQNDVVSVFKKIIKELEIKKDYNNKKGFITTQNHFLNFLKEEYNKDTVDFRHIKKEDLLQFEVYCAKVINGDEPASDASIHTQLKRLRRVFNYAIEEGIINPDVYPFRTYDMPSVTKKYKPRLSPEELQLFKNEKYDPSEAKFVAQNCFLLATRMAGTRIEDMLRLQVKFIFDNRINFSMNKGNTKDAKPRSFVITEEIQAILNHFIKPYSKPDDFIFPYLDTNKYGLHFMKLDKEQQEKVIGSKTSYINSLLKEIADDACISKKVTTHMARHTFASLANNVTKDLEALQQAFGHSDPKITRGYMEEINVESLDGMMSQVRF